MSLANPEEATNIANEYISSIDNLPNEVQFLLGEIKRKDEQVADIEAKALKKSNDIFGRRTNGPLTPREQAGIEKTREYLERITKMNDEKVQLALDLQLIASGAVRRLDYGLIRIRKATGDLVVDVPPVQPLPPLQSVRVAAAAPAAQVAATNVNVTASTATPAVPAYTPQIPVQVPEAVVPPPVAQLSAQKRRRLNASASVLASTSNTTPATPTPAPSVRARPTPQSQPPHAPSPAPAPRKREAARPAPVEELDVDEEEEDAPPDEEDNNPYCYCHQPSHGEMVACDGANCPYEWFHLACLGLKHAPKNSKWYCSECSPPDRAADADAQLPEKGRKRR